MTVTLRPATFADEARLRDWRNDPGTLQSLRGHRPVTVLEHQAWLKRALANPDVLLLVAESGGEPVGTGRLHFDGNGRLLCSVTVALEHRGQGYAPQIIQGLCAHEWRRGYSSTMDVIAEILASNAVSQHAFAHAGFAFVRSEGAGDDAFVVMRCRR